jgi:hypothetical protein
MRSFNKLLIDLTVNSVLNDEIRALISTAVGCTNNRNLVFPIHDFQCKLEGVLEASDNIYSCGLVS